MASIHPHILPIFNSQYLVSGTIANDFHQLGPNTATGHSSVILATENMVNYSLKFIKPVLKGEVRTWEVKESAEREWTNNIQKDLSGSVFQSGGCVSWYYQAGSKWNATVYPRTQIDFTLRCMFPRWSHWDATYTRKGLILLWARRLLKTAVFVTTLLGASYIYRYGREAMIQKSKELLGLIRDTLVDCLRRVRVVS